MKNTNDLILLIVAVLVAGIGITAVILTKPNPIKPAEPDQAVLTTPELPAGTVVMANGLQGGGTGGFGSSMGRGGSSMPMGGPPSGAFMGGGPPTGGMRGGSVPGMSGGGMAGSPTTGPAGMGGGKKGMPPVAKGPM